MAARNSLPDTDWNDALIELAAGLSLDRAGTPELISWATLALEQEADVPALRRLAGCYPQEPLSETLPWFRACLNELQIQLPDQDLLLSEYAAILAKKVLEGRLQAPEGLEQMIKMNYARQDWDPLMIPLCDLQAAIELQPDGLSSYAWLYPDFQRMPLADLIQEECRLYLALRKFELPANLIRSSWCKNCWKRIDVLPTRQRTHWLQRVWRKLSQKPKRSESLCPDCGANDFLPLATLAGRQRYLDLVSAKVQTSNTI